MRRALGTFQAALRERGDSGQGVVAVLQNHAPHAGRVLQEKPRNGREHDEMQIA